MKINKDEEGGIKGSLPLTLKRRFICLMEHQDHPGEASKKTNISKFQKTRNLREDEIINCLKTELGQQKGHKPNKNEKRKHQKNYSRLL